MVKEIKHEKCSRKTFSKIGDSIDIPNLIKVQKDSYDWFIQEGLGEVLKDISPIVDYSGNLVLEFLDYYMEEKTKYTEEEAKERDATYATRLHVKVRLINRETGEIKEQEIYLGDFPVMTDSGTFIINGAERVVVSQLVRSPGCYYATEFDKSGKRIYTSTVMPIRGAWLEYETDGNDIFYARVDRTRKIPVTTLLRALGIVTDEQISELFGDEEKIKKCAQENGLDITALHIKHADTVIEICEEPTEVIKGKKDCSMAVGMKMLADVEGDAFVSAGSTGALVVGATFIVKRIKGIKRPALATILPTATTPTMLLDSGANADCRPEMLTQFGIMGSAYMNKILGVESPRVGLANIGAEESKGRELELETYKQLKNAPVNFVGNIEARQLPMGDCDVCVADGFCGNLMLKLYEGMAKFFSGELKTLLTKDTKSKIAALMVMKNVKEFKKKVDYSEYGGAPLLGTAKPVIKAHGSSNARAFYNAIRQAKQFTETNVIDEITTAIEQLKSKQEML